MTRGIIVLISAYSCKYHFGLVSLAGAAFSMVLGCIIHTVGLHVPWKLLHFVHFRTAYYVLWVSVFLLCWAAFCVRSRYVFHTMGLYVPYYGVGFSKLFNASHFLWMGYESLKCLEENRSTRPSVSQYKFPQCIAPGVAAPLLSCLAEVMGQGTLPEHCLEGSVHGPHGHPCASAPMWPIGSHGLPSVGPPWAPYGLIWPAGLCRIRRSVSVSHIYKPNTNMHSLKPNGLHMWGPDASTLGWGVPDSSCFAVINHGWGCGSGDFTRLLHSVQCSALSLNK